MNEEDYVDRELRNKYEPIDDDDELEEDEEDAADSDDEFKEQLPYQLLERDGDSKLDDEYGEVDRFINAISDGFN